MAGILPLLDERIDSLAFNMTATEHPTDEYLVLAARLGDKNAFGLLVERHLPMARRVALRHINNYEIAQELAQEAILQAYLSLDNLRDASRFQSWLYGIVRNVCRNHLRNQKRDFLSWEAISGGVVLINSVEDPQTAVENRELYQTVREAIESLSPKNQAAAWLFYYEQLSTREIAARLGTSVAAVKDRLYQVRKKLREQLLPTFVPASTSLYFPDDVEKRSMTMIPVTAVHAIQIEETEHYILYLTDTANHRVLPIWVGLYEGHQIAQKLGGEMPFRPMTYHFMANLLVAFKAKLQEVRIEELKDNVYYAIVEAHNGQSVQELDARPSDAIALALHLNAPIVVVDAVMQKAGRELPQPWDEKTGLEELHRLTQERSAKVFQRAIQAETDFTIRGEQIWTQMPDEAVRLNHNYIGTEHLLLSLVRDPRSTAAQALRALGIEPAQVTEAVERVIGRGQQALPPHHQPILAPRVTQVIKLSIEEKNRLGSPALGTGHMLLGLVQEGQGMAVVILRDLGVDPEQLRGQALELMAPG